MILCGLFCSGKSIIGEAVAKECDLPFYDTDRLIEVAQKKPVGEIWRDLGEAAFRDLETSIVLSLKPEPSIIATGGGSLLREENRAHLKQLGETIYLKASVSALWDRLQERGLPAYLNLDNPREHVEQLAHERFPIFEDFCNHSIETEGRTLEQCVIQIKNLFFLP